MCIIIEHKKTHPKYTTSQSHSTKSKQLSSIPFNVHPFYYSLERNDCFENCSEMNEN